VALLFTSANELEKSGGRWKKNAIASGLIGTALVLGAAGYLKLARRLVREHAVEQARLAEFPNQPWKWKKEWAGPAIESDGKGGVVGMWIFALFWNGISAPVAWAFLTGKIRDKAAFVALLFPLVGLGLLGAAIYLTVRARKYGRARFVPSSLPGVIGGYLGGVIEVPARVVLEAKARLSLKCIRRETRGSGKNRRTTENVLWEREERIAHEKWMTGVGGTRIPVLFYIPAECVATDGSDRNNEIVWRLAAEAATPGVDFAVRFVVPVFVTGETAAPPEAGSPLLEEYAAQVLDADALRACGVRREPDAFYFSASHLPGTRFVTAVLVLGFVGLAAWLMPQSVPGVVWGIMIFFGLILALFAVEVWCDGHELKIERDDVVVTKRRPWGTKITRVPRVEVAAVRHEKGMSSGETNYFRLNLVGVEGVDPAGTPTGETFRVRKLRYQLAQLEKNRQVTPEDRRRREAEITAELRRQPKFTVPFAKHIPGQGKAEAIGALVLAAIKGGR
jgi:hypothetical protein